MTSRNGATPAGSATHRAGGLAEHDVLQNDGEPGVHVSIGDGGGQRVAQPQLAERLGVWVGAVRASFDDANLVSSAGLEPVMRLAESCDLYVIVAERLCLPSHKGSNAAGKVATIVADDPGRGGYIFSMLRGMISSAATS
jgi:hypothetical protein